ncbi:MAG: glycosyltransferase [Deltaproteobacteria bacterium]|nr:glycosyltransferase [Deltaproteobacteria bacterium]
MKRNSYNKKIAFFVPSMRGGGAERVMLNLARGFAGEGYDVDLVLTKAEGPYMAKVPPEVNVVDLDSHRVLACLPNLVRYLRQQRPQVMLSTMLHTNIIALLARRLAFVPLRVVLREAMELSEILDSKSFFRKILTVILVRLAYASADGNIAVSQAVARDYEKRLRWPLGRMQVAINAVVTPELIAESQEPVEHPWFQAGEPPVILSAGRLAEEKDYPTLIKAFSLVHQHCSTRLVILGEGKERPALESLISDLGLENEVLLPGFVENPFKYMARARVFVLSSLFEGLPGTLIQAMAVGTPVVATNCKGGVNEILEDGKYGDIVPVGDENKMADAILKNLNCSRERTDTSERLKQRANFFSLENSLKSYASIMLSG